MSRLARTLKPEYADALHEIDVRGVAVKDYAEAHGLTANNAGVRVFRARQALRSKVMASCGTRAEHGCLGCRCGKPRSETIQQTHGGLPTVAGRPSSVMAPSGVS